MDSGCPVSDDLHRVKTPGGHYVTLCAYHAMSLGVTKTDKARRDAAIVTDQMRRRPVGTTVEIENGSL